MEAARRSKEMAWRRRTRRSCWCGALTYDSLSMGRKVITSDTGTEYCFACYGMTPAGQTDITALIGQLAED